jgi:hypothetical protein
METAAQVKNGLLMAERDRRSTGCESAAWSLFYARGHKKYPALWVPGMLFHDAFDSLGRYDADGPCHPVHEHLPA